MYKIKHLIYKVIVGPIVIQVVAIIQVIAFPILKRVLNLKVYFKKSYSHQI